MRGVEEVARGGERGGQGNRCLLLVWYGHLKVRHQVLVIGTVQLSQDEAPGVSYWYSTVNSRQGIRY